MEIAVVAAIALIAIGVVILPLVRKPKAAAGGLSDDVLNAQVKTYRAALKNKTLCEKCLTANPAGSKFCAECGRALG